MRNVIVGLATLPAVGTATGVARGGGARPALADEGRMPELGTSLGLLLAGACGSASSSSPSGLATVTLAVGSETFRVAVTTPEQVTAAGAAQAGGAARIPLVPVE